MERKDILLSGLTKNSKIIEIGPSFSPLAPKREGWNVFTIDHKDQAGLIAKYEKDPNVNTNEIEQVDFVWQEGTLSDAIPSEQHGTFDAFLASHVIEHATDIVAFLKAAEMLVSVEGSIILAVPDKRLCFDFYRPISTTGDAIVAHDEKRVRHSAKTYFDYAMYQAVKENSAGWSRRDTRKLNFNVHIASGPKFMALANSPDYVDAHSWVFTPSSFELMILELSYLELLDLRIEKIQTADHTEFYAWLRRGSLIDRQTSMLDEIQDRRQCLLNQIVLELAEQAHQVVGNQLTATEEHIRILQTEVGAYKHIIVTQTSNSCQGGEQRSGTSGGSVNYLDVLVPANEGFDAICYMLANPDLAKFGAEAALSHFYQFGFKEERKQINPELLKHDSPYRVEKFLRFAKHLNFELLPSQMKFPLVVSDKHFNLADYQSESTNDDFGPFVQDIMANPGNLYLDLGCGLRPRVYSNCLYLEVYPSIAADIVVAPTCTYPFNDNTFDGIGCFAVLEHTRKPWLVVEEIRRMLKPGGKIWIDWPFLVPVHGYPSHFFNATREGLRSIFEDNGFTVQEIGTRSHQGPDFTLTWMFDLLVHALPETARERVLGMSLRDILNQRPLGSFWNELLSQIDDKTRSTLACGNSLIAVLNNASD